MEEPVGPAIGPDRLVEQIDPASQHAAQGGDGYRHLAGLIRLGGEGDRVDRLAMGLAHPAEPLEHHAGVAPFPQGRSEPLDEGRGRFRQRDVRLRSSCQEPVEKGELPA